MNYDTWLMNDADWERFHHFESEDEIEAQYRKEQELERRIDEQRDRDIRKGEQS